MLWRGVLFLVINKNVAKIAIMELRLKQWQVTQTLNRLSAASLKRVWTFIRALLSSAVTTVNEAIQSLWTKFLLILVWCKKLTSNQVVDLVYINTESQQGDDSILDCPVQLLCTSSLHSPHGWDSIILSWVRAAPSWFSPISRHMLKHRATILCFSLSHGRQRLM